MGEIGCWKKSFRIACIFIIDLTTMRTTLNLTEIISEWISECDILPATKTGLPAQNRTVVPVAVGA